MTTLGLTSTPRLPRPLRNAVIFNIEPKASFCANEASIKAGFMLSPLFANSDLTPLSFNLLEIVKACFSQTSAKFSSFSAIFTSSVPIAADAGISVVASTAASRTLKSLSSKRPAFLMASKISGVLGRTCIAALRTPPAGCDNAFLATSNAFAFFPSKAFKP